MGETQYEAKLKSRIRERFPGCVIMKNDASRTQGIPDILILWNNQWAMLEVKMDGSSIRQPNQDYYVEKFHKMSFAAFINPEIQEEVLDAMEQSFESSRQACVP